MFSIAKQKKKIANIKVKENTAWNIISYIFPISLK